MTTQGLMAAMENSKPELLKDLGFLELVLTEAVTDKDVLLSISQLLQAYPNGNWPPYAASLAEILDAHVIGFIVEHVNE